MFEFRPCVKQGHWRSIVLSTGMYPLFSLFSSTVSMLRTMLFCRINELNITLNSPRNSCCFPFFPFFYLYFLYFRHSVFTSQNFSFLSFFYYYFRPVLFILCFNSYTLKAGVQILYMLTVDKDHLSTLSVSVQTRFKGRCSRTCDPFVFFFSDKASFFWLA